MFFSHSFSFFRTVLFVKNVQRINNFDYDESIFRITMSRVQSKVEKKKCFRFAFSLSFLPSGHFEVRVCSELAAITKKNLNRNQFSLLSSLSSFVRQYSRVCKKCFKLVRSKAIEKPTDVRCDNIRIRYRKT